MTKTSLVCALLAILLFSSLLSADTGAKRVVAIEVKGAERSNLEWLQDYLGITVPIQLTPQELDAIKEKLLNTNVFTSVKVTLQPLDNTSREYGLIIDLKEKWTIIPVIRGGMGGGTPLLVVGGYNKHTSGRLWTTGAEARKYGNAPPGGVVWARAPRWLDGYHLLGVELWRDNRIRSIYNDADKEIGTFKTDAVMVRTLYLAPFDKSTNPLVRKSWQYGLDLGIRKQNQSVYDPREDQDPASYPAGLTYNSKTTTLTRLMGQVVYDDIVTISRLSTRGSRMVLSYGPVFNDASQAIDTFSELELFYHYLTPFDFDVAFHALLSSATDKTLQSQYFLGGFNSIRGIPDGVIRGNKAGYMNIELRQIMLTLPKLWVEGVVFADTGGASQHWEDFNGSVRASSGLGLRFAIPQIYRMVFRIDYAWSIDKPGEGGISAGMNQFFEAYRPL